MSPRNWLFTLNNPAGVDISFVDFDQVRYAVWQLERGEEGTPHLQGYIELNCARRFNWMKTIPELSEAHFEIRRGTRAQAREYCMKEESRIDGPFEYGVWKDGGQGKRNDLDSVYKCLKTDRNIVRCLEEYPATTIRYIGNIQKIIPYLQEERVGLPTSMFVYGPPGTGKTSWLKNTYPKAY